MKPIPECPQNLCLARIEAGAMGQPGWRSRVRGGPHDSGWGAPGFPWCQYLCPGAGSWSLLPVRPGHSAGSGGEKLETQLFPLPLFAVSCLDSFILLGGPCKNRSYVFSLPICRCPLTVSASHCHLTCLHGYHSFHLHILGMSVSSWKT